MHDENSSERQPFYRRSLDFDERVGLSIYISEALRDTVKRTGLRGRPYVNASHIADTAFRLYLERHEVEIYPDEPGTTIRRRGVVNKRSSKANKVQLTIYVNKPARDTIRRFASKFNSPYTSVSDFCERALESFMQLHNEPIIKDPGTQGI